MRAVFLDRDGVICKNRSDHVKNWDEFEFLPGAKAGLATLSRLGLPIVIVTNQAVVNRGMASAEMIEEIHDRMVTEITAAGGRVDRIIYCPHRPDEHCTCRKPEPGMLRQAAQEMGLNLKNSYMVGDAATDIVAGQRAGCVSFMVLTGRGLQQLVHAFRTARRPFTITRNLMGATNQILKAELQLAGTGELWQLYSENYRQSIPFTVK